VTINLEAITGYASRKQAFGARHNPITTLEEIIICERLSIKIVPVCRPVALQSIHPQNRVQRGAT
jgi:hypothetical protein